MNSLLSVLWNRSILPVVVGERRGEQCRIPFSRQIRSNNTYRSPPEPAGEHLAVVGQDRLGNTRRANAWERVTHRPAVARSTNVAITQNRE